MRELNDDEILCVAGGAEMAFIRGEYVSREPAVTITDYAAIQQAFISSVGGATLGTAMTSASFAGPRGAAVGALTGAVGGAIGSFAAFSYTLEYFQSVKIPKISIIEIPLATP